MFFRHKNIKVGVVARSLEHLHSLMKEKFGLPDADITLEDGTLLCNEEYFNLLEPQTNLVVQPGISAGIYTPTTRLVAYCSYQQLPFWELASYSCLAVGHAAWGFQHAHVCGRERAA